LSSSAAKKDDDQLAEVVELTPSNDREQGLSRNFEDPVLADLIPGLVQPSSSSLVQETVEAVQELVNEAQGIENFGELEFLPDADSQTVEPAAFELDPLPVPKDGVEEPVQMLMVDASVTGEDNSYSRWEMAEKLFQLVVCERSFDDLVETALFAIMQSLGAHAGAVLEIDIEQQNYFFRVSIGGGDPERVKAFRVPFHKGIVGHVGESRQSILVSDLAADELQMRAISMSVGFDAKTCMAAPIMVAGQLYGVIEVFNRKDGGLFQQRDLQLLEDGTRMLGKVLEVRFLMAELLGHKRDHE